MRDLMGMGCSGGGGVTVLVVMMMVAADGDDESPRGSVWDRQLEVNACGVVVCRPAAANAAHSAVHSLQCRAWPCSSAQADIAVTTHTQGSPASREGQRTDV